MWGMYLFIFAICEPLNQSGAAKDKQTNKKHNKKEKNAVNFCDIFCFIIWVFEKHKMLLFIIL